MPTAPADIQKIAAKLGPNLSSQEDIVSTFKTFASNQAVPFMQEKSPRKSTSESRARSESEHSEAPAAEINLTLVEFLTLAQYMLTTDNTLQKQLRNDLIEFMDQAKKVCVTTWGIRWNLGELRSYCEKIKKNMEITRKPLPPHYEHIFLMLTHGVFAAPAPGERLNPESKNISEYCKKILKENAKYSIPIPVPTPKGAGGSPEADKKDDAAAGSPKNNENFVPNTNVISPPGPLNPLALQADEGQVPEKNGEPGKEQKENEEAGASPAPLPTALDSEIPSPLAGEGGSQGRKGGGDEKDEGGVDAPGQQHQPEPIVPPEPQQVPIPQELVGENKEAEQELPKENFQEGPKEPVKVDDDEEKEEEKDSPQAPLLLPDILALEALNERLHEYESAVFSRSLHKVLASSQSCEFKEYEAAFPDDPCQLKGKTLAQQVAALKAYGDALEEEYRPQQHLTETCDAITSMGKAIQVIASNKREPDKRDALKTLALKIYPNHPGIEEAQKLRKTMAEKWKATQEAEGQQNNQRAITAFIKARREKQNPVIPKNGFRLRALILRLCIIGTNVSESLVTPWEAGFLKNRILSRVEYLAHLALDLDAGNASSLEKKLQSPVSDIAIELQPYMDEAIKKKGQITKDAKGKTQVIDTEIIDSLYDFFVVACILSDLKIETEVSWDDSLKNTFIRAIRTEIREKIAENIKAAIPGVLESHNKVVQEYLKKIQTGAIKIKNQEEVERIDFINKAYGKRADAYLKLYEQTFTNKDQGYPEVKRQYDALIQSITALEVAHKEYLTKEGIEKRKKEKAAAWQERPREAEESPKGPDPESPLDSPQLSDEKEEQENQDQEPEEPSVEPVKAPKKQPRPPAGPPPSEEQERREREQEANYGLLPPAAKANTIPWKGILAFLFLGLVISGLGVGILAAVAPQVLFIPILATVLSYGTLGAIGGIIAGTVAIGVTLGFIGIAVWGLVSLRQKNKVEDRRGYSSIDIEVQRGQQDQRGAAPAADSGVIFRTRVEVGKGEIPRVKSSSPSNLRPS